MSPEALGRGLLVAAIVLALVGLALIIADRLGWTWRPLPGDVVIRRPGVTLLFPVTTMLLLSLLGTLVLWLLRRLRH